MEPTTGIRKRLTAKCAVQASGPSTAGAGERAGLALVLFFVFFVNSICAERSAGVGRRPTKRVFLFTAPRDSLFRVLVAGPVVPGTETNRPTGVFASSFFLQALARYAASRAPEELALGLRLRGPTRRRANS